MTQFSSEYQPTNKARKRDTCRRGHSMVDGDQNVRIRRDGRRLCRACESVFNSSRYFANKPIKPPFDIGNLYFEESRYAHTSIPVLQSFLNWQRKMLDYARAANPDSKTNGISREFIITCLEAQIPITEHAIAGRRY